MRGTTWGGDVTDTPMDLRGLIDRALDEQQVTSNRALERRAKEMGRTLSNATISQLRTGTYPVERLGKKTLETLSLLAKIPYADVCEIAGLARPPGISFTDQVPDDVDEWLTPKDRRVSLDVIRSFIEVRKALAAAQGGAAPAEASPLTGRTVLRDRDDPLLHERPSGAQEGHN